MSQPSPYRTYLDPNECIWADGNGGIHVDVPKLLGVLGLPETPENEMMVDEELSKFAAQYGMNSTTIFDR